MDLKLLNKQDFKINNKEKYWSTYKVNNSACVKTLWSLVNF